MSFFKSNNSLTPSFNVLGNQNPIIYTSITSKDTNTSSSIQALQNQTPIVYSSLTSGTSTQDKITITPSSSSLDSFLGNIDTTTMLYIAGGILALYLVLRD